MASSSNSRLVSFCIYFFCTFHFRDFNDINFHKKVNLKAPHQFLLSITFFIHDNVDLLVMQSQWVPQRYGTLNKEYNIGLGRFSTLAAQLRRKARRPSTCARCSRAGGPEVLRRHLNFRQISHRFTLSFTNTSFQDLNGSHIMY